MKKIKFLTMLAAMMLMAPLFVNAQDADEDGESQPSIVNEFFKTDPEQQTDEIKKILVGQGNAVNLILSERLMSANKFEKRRAEEMLVRMAQYVGQRGYNTYHNILSNGVFDCINIQKDVETNVFLISLFEYFGDKRDLEKLWRFVENGNYADAAIRAMSHIPESVDNIRRFCTKQGEVSYKGALAYAVGKLQMKDVEPTIISWLKGADAKTQVDIYNALYELDNPQSAKLVQKGAKKLYKSKNAEAKIGGMKLLVELQKEEALPYLYKALKNKNREVRRAALDLMVPYANNEMCENVVKKYAKKDAVADVARWLGDVKDKNYVKYLVGLLASEDELTVEEAVLALGKIGDPDGLMALAPMVGGKYKDAVEEALVESPGEIVPVLKKAISGSDEQVIGVMRILVKRQCYALNIQLRQFLMYQKNLEIMQIAYQTLKYVVLPGHVSFLKEQLENCPEEYVKDVQNAFIVAMSMAQPQQRDDFVNNMKYVPVEVLPRYYRVLGSFDTETSVKKLVDCYNSGIEKDKAYMAIKMVDADKYQEVLRDIKK
ncbi:MAG: HEAT repeat domain-containing protein [Bacteroidales bacterium]|nr:HEAT repeat domain-containing protein [Bacteroidales bacterium]